MEAGYGRGGVLNEKVSRLNGKTWTAARAEDVETGLLTKVPAARGAGVGVVAGGGAW